MSTKKSKRQKFELDQKRNRTFSESFKRSKIKEIEAKRLTIREVCELYEVSRSSVYNWLYKYSSVVKGTKMVVQMESEGEKVKQLNSHIAELERIIGQKQLELDYLSKTLELASDEVGYDLKKKHGIKS